MNPFLVPGPALVSFSGGRTSGMMLWKTVEAHGGRLPADVLPVFANTGKEREETLEFVRDVEANWGVPVVWVERPHGGGFRVVEFGSASRLGEPFTELIRQRKFLPNPVTRYCTTDLKIRVMRDYLRSLGWKDADWTNVVGLRADEPKRVAKLRARKEAKWDVAVPLYDAGITKTDVDDFWRAQPFDLRLQPWEGNCDLCFLKGVTKRQRIMHDRPDLAAWWIRTETETETKKKTAARFRSDAPSYARLYDVTTRQLRLVPDEDPGSCNIGDIDDCQCGDWSEAA